MGLAQTAPGVNHAEALSEDDGEEQIFALGEADLQKFLEAQHLELPSRFTVLFFLPQLGQAGQYLLQTAGVHGKFMGHAADPPLPGSFADNPGVIGHICR